MPYLTEAAKRRVESEGATNAGELNYVLTLALTDYIHRKGLNYQTLNDAIGALEGAKLELYRRIAAPYEDGKIADNGDVYPAGWLNGLK
jgi:hypothetical protein